MYVTLNDLLGGAFAHYPAPSKNTPKMDIKHILWRKGIVEK